MNPALLGGLAAATPGIVQGVQGVMDDKKTQADAAGAGAANAAANPSQYAPLQDPDHPAWQIMANMTGGQGGPLAGGQEGQQFNSAGVAQPALPAQPQFNAAGTPVAGMQNGGVVRQNFGKAAVYPEFTRQHGGAIPTGPNNTVTSPPTARGGMLTMENGGPVPALDPTGHSTGLGQGITPASPTGQMQTMECGGPVLGMDAGGVVPQGFIPQGNLNVPMTGPAAGFVQGFGAGQTIGHNLQQQWEENENRTKAADNAYNVAGIDVNNPNSGNGGPPSMLDHAKNAVEGFFHQLHGLTLDENHTPNASSAIPGAGPGGSPAGSAPQAAPAGAANGLPIAAAPGGASAPNGVSPSPAIPGAGPGGSPAGSAPQAAPAGAANGLPIAAAPGGASAPNGVSPSPAIPGAGPAGSAAAPAATAQPGGQPAGQPSPVAQQTSQQAVQDANSSATTQSGTPSKTPEQSGLAHSLTPAQWQNITRMKQEAAYAAAKAGEDPQKVLESLDAMQNAHFQGQIVKQLSTANVAFQNGDMDAMKQALKNVNYYLPNGQDVTFKPANADAVAADKTGQTKLGDLMYANPFHGLAGHENEPEYTKIDQQHLQMLGVAALDPMNVQKAQLAQYSAQNEREFKMRQSEAELRTAAARQGIANARQTVANVDQLLAVGKDRLTNAKAGEATAHANYWNSKAGDDKGNGGQVKVTYNDYSKAGNEAAMTVRQNVMGKPRMQPAMIPNPNNPTQMIPNPAANGRPQNDPNAIPGLYQGMDANMQQKTENLAHQFAGANLGVVAPQEAADLAARVVKWESTGSKGSHTDPQTHAQEPDVKYEPENNSVHVWVGNGWRSIWGTPRFDRTAGKGGEPALPEAVGEGGGGGGAGPDTQNDETF